MFQDFSAHLLKFCLILTYNVGSSVILQEKDINIVIRKFASYSLKLFTTDVRINCLALIHQFSVNLVSDDPTKRKSRKFAYDVELRH